MFGAIGVVTTIAAISGLVAGGAARDDSGAAASAGSTTAASRPIAPPVQARPTEVPEPAPPGYAFAGVHIKAPILFCTDSTDPALESAVVDAVAVWQHVARDSIPIGVTDTCLGTGVREHDGRSVVTWDDLPDNVAGTAHITNRNESVVEGDIIIDNGVTHTCLLAVVLHEVGHILGLAHQDDSTSVMYPTTRCVPEVSARDAAAVRHLYPAR